MALLVFHFNKAISCLDGPQKPNELLSELFLFVLFSRWSVPWRLFHPNYHQAQSWDPVLPFVHLQREKRPATRRRVGPLTSLPVWGSDRQACPGGLPPVPLSQPGRRKVSHRAQIWMYSSFFLDLFRSILREKDWDWLQTGSDGGQSSACTSRKSFVASLDFYTVVLSHYICRKIFLGPF